MHASLLASSHSWDASDCLFSPIFEILFEIPLSWEAHQEPYLDFSLLFRQRQFVPSFKSDSYPNAQVHLGLGSLVMKGTLSLWQAVFGGVRQA